MNNKIAVVFELPGMTSKDYDAIMNELKAQRKTIDENRPSHVAFQKGEGWCVIDVWNSQEALIEFGQTTLFPIFAKLGLTPPQPQIFPAHHFIGTSMEETLAV